MLRSRDDPARTTTNAAVPRTVCPRSVNSYPGGFQPLRAESGAAVPGMGVAYDAIARLDSEPVGSSLYLAETAIREK